jgi:hypothetical protein
VIHVVEKRPKPLSSGLGFSANLEAGAQHVWAKPEEWPEVVLPFYASLDEMLRRMHARSPPSETIVSVCNFPDQLGHA